MEYISEEEVLPSPFNLARIPRSVIEWIFNCRPTRKSDEPDETPDIYDMDNGSPPPTALPITRNGLDVSNDLL